MPGEPIAVTLFWSPPRPDALPARVVLQLHARDGGRSWARTQGGVPHPSYTLTPPESAPEGAYTLDLALYQPNGRPLRPVTPESDSRAGSEFHTLADLTHPPDVSREAPDPDVPIRAALGDAIELVGYDIPDWVSPGETFRIALYWRAVQPPPDDYTVFVHVLDDEMQMLAQGDGKPVYGFHPTEAWQAGEVIRDVHVMTLDPGIVRQNARVQVGMYAADSGERLPVTLASGEAAPQRALRLHTLRVR